MNKEKNLECPHCNKEIGFQKCLELLKERWPSVEEIRKAPPVEWDNVTASAFRAGANWLKQKLFGGGE